MGAPQTPKKDAEATTLTGDFGFGDDDTRPGGRQVLSREELLMQLTSLIQGEEGCEKVRVIEVTRLDPPDTAGCNWSMAVVLDAAGVAPEVYALAYGAVIGMARESWNLA